MNRKITVLGGDTRQVYTAEYLAEKGYDVRLFGFGLFGSELKTKTAADLTGAMQSELVILPLPCTKNGKTLFAPFAEHEYELNDILSRAVPGTLLFAGKAPASFEAQAKAAGCAAYDYFTREELTLKNALLTGEGILELMLDRLPVTVYGARTAITGYGRVGYYASRMLHSLGAEVTVFARSPVQLAKAETAGLTARTLSGFGNGPQSFDCLINTVPSPILGRDELRALNKSCLLIETASAPFGIDKDAAADMGFTLLKAQSLPGKTAPKSAGKIIADTLDAMLREVTN